MSRKTPKSSTAEPFNSLDDAIFAQNLPGLEFESELPNLFLIFHGSAHFCLNQDFQDYRIFRIILSQQFIARIRMSGHGDPDLQWNGRHRGIGPN